ncbi:MAG: glycosyltransferase [Gemmatimonadota bacterium]|nr:glycosyltransferase [Gemmatimonadota bacterium]
MRVLIVGSANPWRMEAATRRALIRAGHEVLILDDRRTKRAVGRRLTQHLTRARAQRFAPDFIFLSKCLALDLDTVQRLVANTPNAMWYHDPQWYRDTDRPDIGHIAAVGRIASTFFVTGFDSEWRALGLNAKFLPAAGDAAIRPVTPAAGLAGDVAFIGTGYDPTRAALLLALAKHYDVRVYGPAWEQWATVLKWNGRSVENDEFARVCSSSAITLGINPARADGAATYTSDRTWMVILAGAFYLGQGTRGVTQFLRDGEHCAWYDDTPECIDRIAYYLREREERERIRTQGERFVRANHTYDQRIANLLSGREWTVDSLVG